MISNWQKIAFLEHELLINLKLNKGNKSKEFNAWFEYAVDILEQYKQYYINRISDEEERQWREIMD